LEGKLIQDGATVKVHFTLKVDGQLVQSTAGGEPLTYVQGSGQILPGLEKELEGLNEGDKKAVDLPPEKGYGHRDPDAMRRVSRSAFRDPDNVEVGQRVSGESDGKRFEATIAEVKPDAVTLDMNHPLAGRTLQFQFEVLEVR
jgi:FKBP-type peptidyl-prolyl cis-trans isomerase SlyD